MVRVLRVHDLAGLAVGVAARLRRKLRWYRPSGPPSSTRAPVTGASVCQDTTVVAGRVGAELQVQPVDSGCVHRVRLASPDSTESAGPAAAAAVRVRSSSGAATSPAPATAVVASTPRRVRYRVKSSASFAMASGCPGPVSRGSTTS